MMQFGMYDPSAADNEAKKNRELQAQIDQLRLQPARPDYQGYTNADGTLKDQFKLLARQITDKFGVDPNAFVIDSSGYNIPKFDEVTMDPTALNMIKEQAFNQGPSSWAQLMNLQQARNQQDAMDSVKNQGAGARATAMGDLSRLGGMSSGAMERLARSGERDNAFAGNAVLRQGMSDKTNIGLADAAQKADLLKALPGFEQGVANLKLQNNAAATDINKFNTSNQIDLSKYNTANQIDLNKFNTNMAQQLAQYNNTLAAQTDQYNMGNQLKDIEGKNAYTQGVYSDQMKAWAAERQAQATEKAGK